MQWKEKKKHNWNNNRKKKRKERIILGIKNEYKSNKVNSF